MRRRSRLLVRLLLPGALVVLVGSLAALQYRWLGQVSEADRNRRQATLQQNAVRLADDFDREIVRLYVALQGTSEVINRRDWEAFAVLHDRWRHESRFPHIVRTIYLVEHPGEHDTLLAFDPSRRTFDPATWPASLAPVRTQLRQASPPPPTWAGSTTARSSELKTIEARAMLTTRDTILPSIPAIVVTLPFISPETPPPPQGTTMIFTTSVRVGAGHLVAELDRDQIRQSMLPALVDLYFPAHDSDEYRFAVIDGRRPGEPIYARGVDAGATLDPSRADATVPMFTLRLDLATPMLVRPLAATPPRSPMPAPGGAGGMGASAGGAASSGGRRAVSPIGPPMPAGRGGPGGGGRGGARSGVADMSIVVQSTMARGERDVFVARRSPSWQLVLQHSAGSLDAAVAQARRRNLWLSFGILGVLAAGMMLVVANAQRSQRLAAQQMDFVATVSHELRTPLTVIRSAAQNLSAGVVSDPDQARRYGDLIETEGRRLTDMVEQVLQYAGISDARGVPLSRPTDAGALVQDTVSSFAPLFDAAGIVPAVTIEPNLPAILADEGAIRRSVHNLLANALKHGADGGSVEVSVRRATTGGRPEVAIAVGDRGRGIEAAELPHIFEPFYRGRHALEQQVQGNGLGLSLVKRIAEAHGGRVTVQSAPGQGATFTLHLPPAPADAAAEHMPAADAASPSTSLFTGKPAV